MELFEDLRNTKLNQAKLLLEKLKLPPQQCNDRSAWVFLALSGIKPGDEWNKASSNLLQTYVIMEFIRSQYGKDYKPNSRETIRRQTLHQFEQARIIDRNRDMPDRPTNSKDNNYSLNKEVIDILKEYPNGNWEVKVNEFDTLFSNLVERYNREIEMHKVPVTLPDGKTFTLSPGPHNELQKDIIHEFSARFIGEGGEVLYVGDTASSRNEGGKFLHLEGERMLELGIPVLAHDKLPDVLIYDSIRNWLFLIEAVTSHGPISPKRWEELEAAFESCAIGRVYVTAFLDELAYRKYAADIAWETEVWISSRPTHMIHYNGDRFLGPHKKE